MTRHECYEQIYRLTAELKRTDIATYIFEAAKKGNPKEVEIVFEVFKMEYEELYRRVVDFGKRFNSSIERIQNWGIFGTENDIVKGIHVFDPNKLDAKSFCALIYLANINELFMFVDDFEDSSEVFLAALKDEGYEELAEFIANASWDDYVGEDEQYETIYDLLVDIFEGRFAGRF